MTERTEEVPLADLQVMLEDAVRQEDYQAAARLRDELMCATESNPTCALLQQSVQVLQLRFSKRYCSAHQLNDLCPLELVLLPK